MILVWIFFGKWFERKRRHPAHSESTKEFVLEIAKNNESQSADNQLWSKSTNAENQIDIKKKGRMTINGKTPDKVWMHPFLFIDFAMWISPSFKYDVIKFVYDELINYRNEAGDAYGEMAITIVMRKFRQ